MNRRGLTLVEWMVLLAIVAVLAAILVPNFIKARTQGRNTGCKSNLKNIGTALEMYLTDHKDGFPPDLSQLTPNYLKTIPTCASVGRVTYRYRGTQAGNQSVYTIVCGGLNHRGLGIEVPNYPQYSSVTGLVERP